MTTIMEMLFTGNTLEIIYEGNEPTVTLLRKANKVIKVENSNQLQMAKLIPPKNKKKAKRLATGELSMAAQALALVKSQYPNCVGPAWVAEALGIKRRNAMLILQGLFNRKKIERERIGVYIYKV